MYFREEEGYLAGMAHLLTRGHVKEDRTGVGTRSLFGMQLRFDLRNDVFPLLTTKRLHTRSIIHELLWFLRGSTDNEELNAVGVSIWNEWALPEDVYTRVPLANHERASLLAEALGLKLSEAIARLNEADRDPHDSGEQLLARHNIPTHLTVKTHRKGELGPIYGQQWRAWRAPDGRLIDQMAEVIHTLKTRPGSRRMVVTAWNPADLPDESVSPQTNVLNGRMALAACHCLFQFWTRPLSLEERIQEGQARGLLPAPEALTEDTQRRLDELNIPQYALSCQLYQRSADYFLGTPFNIASYALLTRMVAQVVNMVAEEFVWAGGDVHLYRNHIPQAIEQRSREPRPFPLLKLNPQVKNLEDFTFEDIQILNYHPHPAIKAPVAV